ncbi:cobalamin B12-binding domain-containing protein [Tumebacillus sp. ITR2]|uniref:Cobalamin B12-binding domain-containing protein n=1 Tax=Tumebacillus amylolyticus TaxID=2801339 RepID=A0ABS1J824_9BACL|nr:cobalamin B12-binding domain-containing protein [Tumebacillus amylolyticus]MBL0386436.1 cobalamin B12-binding domain-containing protein [Tumebacillus amylolyticus]
MNLEAERFAEHLLTADLELAWTELERYTRAGQNSLFLYHRLLTPALYHIGRLWERDAISVADEHLATGVCEVLLSRFESSLAAKPVVYKGASKRVLLFGMEQERHILGLRMVASQFREAGWQVRFLGADLPLEYAVNAASRWKPDAIGITLSITRNLPSLELYVNTLEALDHSPTVLVGGRLVSLCDLTPYVSEQTVLVNDLLHLAQWLYGGVQRATS